MKQFDFRAYLKKNPLLKESVNEKYSNWTNWQPGFEDFWDRVYDGAIEKAIEISKESGDDMNIEEISKAIENECANPNRVMQSLEADGEVDEAIHYVLDSLEIGEPMGMGATQKARLYNPTNQVGFNPFRNKGSMMEKLSQGDNVISIDLDMGWDDSDPEEDKWAKASFKKYHIKVSKIDDIPGNYKVTGTKENILNYLKSDYYDMDQEDIEEYYPELLAKDSFIQANRDAVGMPGSKMYENNPLGNTGYDTDTDAQNWYNTEGINDEEPVSDYSRRRRDTDDSFIQAQRLAAGEPDEDDEEIYHADFDNSDSLDARERFLGLGGQEILDNIKFLVDDGFELEDIIKQIQQHANYVQSPTINEGMDDDSSLFGPNIEKSRPGKLSDYYRSAESPIKQIASQIDKVLEGVNIPEEELINLSDLIIDLADEYADFRIDMYTDDQMSF